MESHLHRRPASAPVGPESPGHGSSPPADFASLVLLRLPDLHRAPERPLPVAAQADHRTAESPSTSALYESKQPANADRPKESPQVACQPAAPPPAVECPPVEEPAKPSSATKTWRSDARHSRFQPEKYGSNLTTKAIAGAFSLAAVVLVYFALFGGKTDESPSLAGDRESAEFDDRWTDEQGELEVALGTESTIGESSPAAGPLAGDRGPRDERFPSRQTISAAPPLAADAIAEPDDAPDYDPTRYRREPGETEQAMSNEPEQPRDPMRRHVLPWRQEGAAAEAAGYATGPADAAEIDEHVPQDAYAPLNGPLTQNGSAGSRYRSTGTPAPSISSATADAGGEYHSAGYLPGSPRPEYDRPDYDRPGYGWNDERSTDQARRPTDAYQSALPGYQPQGGAEMPRSPTGAPDRGSYRYPTTSSPAAGSLAPAAHGSGGYQTDNSQQNPTATPRTWSR